MININFYGIATEIDMLDIFYKIGTVVIALVNVIFILYIFLRGNKKNDEQKEKDRNINWLKTLVLDHNLKYLYSSFDDLEKNLKQLNQESIDFTEKQKIIDCSDDLFINLRRKFTDSLLSIETTLYDAVQKQTDELQEIINTNTFNDGLNLSNEPMYNQSILDPITKSKTDILKLLFKYRG
jgi:hypothetical protein